VIPVDISLHKPGVWKRFAAWLLDAILLCVLATGIAFVFSAAFGYDSYSDKLNAAYAEYEERYGISLGITEDEYNALSEEKKQLYMEASSALSADEEANYNYNMVVNLSVLIVTLSLLCSYLVLELLVPVLLKNGQTVGKKVLSIALCRVDLVRITNLQLAVRTVLGKFTVETMIPVYLVIMLLFGGIGVFGTVLLLAFAVAQLVIMSVTHTNSLIHDLIAGTVAVDLTTQKLFGSSEELLEYKKRLHAARVAEQAY